MARRWGSWSHDRENRIALGAAGVLAFTLCGAFPPPRRRELA
jgi:hypothetical protein